MNSIVKLSNNDSWYFYYDSRNGICFSRLNSQGEMSESGVLSADSPDDFDVICDESNNIHMCCQNRDGHIVYFRYKGGVWNKTILLKSKSNSTKKKHFHLFSINGWINLFYVLEYRGKNMLTHHIPERNNGEPEVVDYIGESYTVSKDLYGNIHIFYDSEIKSAFGGKTYTWSKKKWSDFNPMPHLDNCDTLLTTFNNDNKLMIITAKNKEIHFMCDEIDATISTGEKPVILNIRNTCIVQWTYRGRIYTAISVGGNSFNKSGEYTFNKRLTPELYRVSCQEKDINAEYCYGYRSGDKIVFFELESIPSGNDRYEENIIEVKNEKTETSTPEIVKEEKTDYTADLNKLILLLTSVTDSLSKIQSQITSCETKLESIESIIKEPPEGGSKKRKTSRV